MRTVALAAALWALAGGGALGQEVRWQHPDGTFSLALADNGWRQVQRADRPDWFSEDFTLLATPIGDDGPQVVCSVQLNASGPSLPDTTQTVVNGRMQRQAQPLADRISSMGHQVRDVAQREIDDVTVIEISSSSRGLDTIQLRFAIVREGVIKVHLLACSAPLGDEAGLDSIRAMLGSLRFGSHL